MISQSRVAEFLARKCMEFPEIAKKKIGNFCKYDPSSVISIHYSSKMIEAFRTMSEKVQKILEKFQFFYWNFHLIFL